MSRYLVFIVIFIIIQAASAYSQLPKLRSIVLVTDDLDSLARSFTRQGFTVQPGLRDPIGLFTDRVVLPNRSTVIFESPRLGSNWRKDALWSLGPFISELRFAAPELDSLHRRLELAGIGVVLIDSADPSRGFMIDSTSPLLITFANDTLMDPATTHPRGYYRVDWLILGASPDVETRLRIVFDVVGFLKSHRGCCDFWRSGPADDFTFLRFESPQPPWRGEPMWLSIGKNALFFAYH